MRESNKKEKTCNKICLRKYIESLKKKKHLISNMNKREKHSKI
jgi:hypothetical protein